MPLFSTMVTVQGHDSFSRDLKSVRRPRYTSQDCEADRDIENITMECQRNGGKDAEKEVHRKKGSMFDDRSRDAAYCWLRQ